MVGHPASEGNPHAVNRDQQRPAKGASRCERDDVTGMNAQLVQPALQSVTAFNSGDTCLISREQLIERHGP
jgi:hypothetical protein